jgi:hypothetical protein
MDHTIQGYDGLTTDYIPWKHEHINLNFRRRKNILYNITANKGSGPQKAATKQTKAGIT